jgi:hypothetical protein
MRILLQRLMRMLMPPIIIGILIPILALILLCGWLVILVPKSLILPATRTPTATVTATVAFPIMTPTETFTPTFTLTSTSTQLIISEMTLSGVFQETLLVTVDPAGHKQYSGLPDSEELNVIIESNTITISGPAPWVTVTGNLNPDGSFKATGSGSVAGYPNINVEFDGTISAKDGLAGDYTMGVGGGLPTNRSITYHLQGQRVQALATNEVMREFLGQLATALNTNDAMFLFNNLHPVDINLYGAQTCQAPFQQRSPDPSYQIEFISMTGPAAWVYAPPGQA